MQFIDYQFDALVGLPGLFLTIVILAKLAQCSSNVRDNYMKTKFYSAIKQYEDLPEVRTSWDYGHITQWLGRKSELVKKEKDLALPYWLHEMTSFFVKTLDKIATAIEKNQKIP